MGRKKQPTESGKLQEAFARIGLVIPADQAEKLVILARQHWAIQLRACNGTNMQMDDAREERIEAEIQTISKRLGLRAHFDGDPRGFTVKLHAPDQSVHNTWGGREVGYGIGEAV